MEATSQSHVETLARLRAARDSAATELQALIDEEADASRATGLKRLLQQAEHALNPHARETETQQLRERLAVIDSAIGSFGDAERQRLSDAAAAVAHAHLPKIAKARKGLLAAMNDVAAALAAVDAQLQAARAAGGAVPAAATVAGREARGWKAAINATAAEVERDDLLMLTEAEAAKLISIRALVNIDNLKPGETGKLAYKRAVELELVGKVERI